MKKLYCNLYNLHNAFLECKYKGEIFTVKKDIVDRYYKYIEEEYCCKISEELLGKKYIIGEQFGSGNFCRMKIEDGLEISRCKISKMEMDFDNREFNDEILEVGYCYSGSTKVLCRPNKEEYVFKEGDIFIYKTVNDVEYFKFKYNNCKTISIHINFNIIKNVINSIWEDKMIIDWQNNVNDIFKGHVLIVEKASCEMKKIAEEIEAISIDNMLGYMKLKFKTIELLATFLEEKSRKKTLENSIIQETEIIIKAKNIINKNLQKVPLVKELAYNLNISTYKLQEEFKNSTGATVYEYIKKLRIEKAKYLLRNTNMSILEITNEIGYENPSKFSKLFKQYNNITPLKYRKLNV